MLDPIAESDDTEQRALTQRPTRLDNQRIGLCTNGKKAAEPTLQVLEEQLTERYPELSFTYYKVPELNMLKDDGEIESIQRWAHSETDACFTAIGDCGSCTKFLTWVTDAIEVTETPAVGLLAHGFELDWQSNARDLERPIRHVELPVRPERIDIDRIHEKLPADVIDEIETELVRPRTDHERGAHTQTES